MKNFKRITIFVLIFITVIIFYGCENHTITEEYQLIRIHIRANSNSEEDQAVKLLVRDAISAYLETELNGVTDFETAYNMISERKSKLTDKANSVLAKSGFNYKSEAKLTNEYFPTRSYENVVVESGYYDALIVNLGDGAGDNWWCVIYPPLCYLEAEGSGKVQYKSYIAKVFKKYFND